MINPEDLAEELHRNAEARRRISDRLTTAAVKLGLDEELQRTLMQDSHRQNLVAQGDDGAGRSLS